jgi:hypothetical protein
MMTSVVPVLLMSLATYGGRRLDAAVCLPGLRATVLMVIRMEIRPIKDDDRDALLGVWLRSVRATHAFLS